ncbi:MAG: hypothetical protein LBM96_10090 [Methanobrevibacter sp.]|jgi:hypothetical protein|nr:hypothetical protein [Candidatus Methanoflexus mossambicus]
MIKNYKEYIEKEKELYENNLTDAEKDKISEERLEFMDNNSEFFNELYEENMRKEASYLNVYRNGKKLELNKV